MPRKSLLTIPLDASKAQTLQDQLALGLKRRIQNGALAAGTGLPSSRELAAELGIARNTAIAAYDRLIGEGYLEARPRSGLFVVEGLVKPSGMVVPPATATLVTPAKRVAKHSSELPFRHSRPDVRLFPLQSWARTHSRCLRTHGRALLSYLPSRTLGLPVLQESLARYLRESRGVHCRAGQIAITTGSQQALYLLAHLLGTSGTRSMIEDPGYGLARRAFESTPTRLVPVPVDLHGALVPIESAATVAAIYLTPSRQFPTGASMPVARRLQWIDYAARTKAWIIEDDYDSEFRYGHAPLPCLQSLDKNGRVIYVGTMSKVLFPALRIGYAVLPEELIPDFAALREAVDDHGPVLDQLTLAEFITTGDFYRHVKRCRKAYAERQHAFLDAAANDRLPFDFPHTDGGMNLTGFLNNGMEDSRVYDALLQQGIDAPPLSRYSIHARMNGLMFGFTAHTPAVIRAAVRRVGEVIRTLG